MSLPIRLRSAIHTALDRIGHRNSHACPPDGANFDPLLHELFVSHEGWSHFDKRRKAAIKQSIEVAGEAEVDKVEPGTEQSVLDGVHFALIIKRNQPSERIDRAKLNTALRKRGFSDIQAMEFISEISTLTKAATSVRAVPRA